jgi:hypothetical protein
LGCVRGHFGTSAVYFPTDSFPASTPYWMMNNEWWMMNFELYIFSFELRLRQSIKTRIKTCKPLWLLLFLDLSERKSIKTRIVIRLLLGWEKGCFGTWAVLFSTHSFLALTPYGMMNFEWRMMNYKFWFLN